MNYIIQLELSANPNTAREQIIWYLESMAKQFPEDVKKVTVKKMNRIVEADGNRNPTT